MNDFDEIGRAVAFLKWRLSADSMPEDVRRAFDRVLKEIENLKKELEKLRDENGKLQEQNRKLRRDFDDYRNRHPETVGVKNGKAYEIKAETPTAGEMAANPTKRKPGAQPGHKPHNRPLAEPTEVVPVPVSVCPHGADHVLSAAVQETRTRTVEDVVIVKPGVTQYEIERRYCRDCEALVEAIVPGVLPGARLGLRAMLIVAWLRYDKMIPQGAIPEILEKMCGLRISEGEVQGCANQLAQAYGPFHESLIEDLRSRAVKNVDETVWRTNGKHGYLWAFVTKWETIFEIASTRKHEVPLRVLGEKAGGTIVTDGFSGYKSLVDKTKLKQARCWAHILQDSKELAEFYPDEGPGVHAGMQSIYARAKAYEGRGTPEDVAGLKAALDALLDRSFNHSKVATFARNVRGIHQELFLFVTNPEVEGTNNRAERALRPIVIWRPSRTLSSSQHRRRVRQERRCARCCAGRCRDPPRPRTSRDDSCRGRPCAARGCSSWRNNGSAGTRIGRRLATYP